MLLMMGYNLKYFLEYSIENSSCQIDFFCVILEVVISMVIIFLHRIKAKKKWLFSDRKSSQKKIVINLLKTPFSSLSYMYKLYSNKL